MFVQCRNFFSVKFVICKVERGIQPETQILTKIQKVLGKERNREKDRQRQTKRGKNERQRELQRRIGGTELHRFTDHEITGMVNTPFNFENCP